MFMNIISKTESVTLGLISLFETLFFVTTFAWCEFMHNKCSYNFAKMLN